MASLWGNDNGGGGSGPNGHRVIVTYSYSQSVAGNYTDVAWQYGVDYGDPNWWNNISSRSVAWSVNVGASVSSVSGSGTGTSSGATINTSDPGYGGQIHYFYSGTVRLNHDSNGHGTIHLTASMSFSSGSYTSTINTNIPFPNIVRPPTAPGTPTLTRTSDTQIGLSWTNNATGDRPYTNVKVYRSTDGGGYALVATLGAVTTYSDTGTSANHKYAYKVEATNTAGSAQSAASSAIWTTPGIPTSLTATKLAGGNIRLTWVNNVNFSEYTVRIEESANGGAYAEIASVAAGTTTWDHVAPNPAQTHKYRVRARTSSGTTLNSSYSNESATIVLLSTANAPTGLSPSGPIKDATETIGFTWTHNPSDGTPQSKYQLQYKIGAGAFVTVGPTTSGFSSYTMPANTVTNGQTITWHVATAGENGTIGAYSADAVFTTQSRPTSTVSAPTGVYNQSKATATWTYFQAQGTAQSAWHAYLYLKGALNDYSDATLVGEGAGSGATSSFQFPTTLLDGQTYGVRVYVTSAAGLTSLASGTPIGEFTVDFLDPADATITGLTYDPDYGQMVLAIQGSGASASVQGLVLDGTNDWGTTVDNAVLDIAGDIDLRARIQPVSWAPASDQAIVGKWESLINQRSYALVLLATGALKFRISTDGTFAGNVEAASSVVVGAPDNTVKSVRVARVGSTVTFYTSDDVDLETATWTQLGTTQTVAGTIFNSTSALTLGGDGATSNLNGIVFSAVVKNSAGTTVANPIYTSRAAGTTSFADAAGRTWTLVGNANIATIIPAFEAIDTVDVQRQIDGGDWVTWVAGIVLDASYQATLVDTAPTIKGTNNYRLIIRSAVPSSKLSPELALATAEPSWGFLSTGPGFAQVVRMRARLANKTSLGRNKSTYHFAGRGRPVELSGEETNLTLSVSATLFPPSMGGLSSEPEELESLALTTTVVLWRDYSGRRIYASLSDVGIDYATRANKFPVGFTLTQVDYDEHVG